MALDRIDVRESGAIGCPFEVFRETLADVDAEAVPIRGATAGTHPETCAAFVTTHAAVGNQERYPDIPALHRESLIRLEIGRSLKECVV